MRPSCPECKGETVGYGRRSSSVLAVVGGRLQRRPTEVHRFRCKSCGTIHSPAGRTVPDAVVKAVVSNVQRHGVLGASNALGCDRSVIELIFRRWVADQDAGRRRIVPGAFGVHVFQMGNEERIMLCDLENESLVEIFDDHASMVDWLQAAEGSPRLAIIDVDARNRYAIEKVLPKVEIGISTSSAQEALAGAAENTLRSITRAEIAKGRNFRENPDLLTRSDALLTDLDREELGAWSKAARALRRWTIDLSEALTGASDRPKEEGGRQDADFRPLALVLKQAAEALRTLFPGSQILAVVNAWSSAMLVGCRNKWVDDAFLSACGLASRIRRLASRVKFDVLRSALLMSSPPGLRLSGVGRSIERLWGPPAGVGA